MSRLEFFYSRSGIGLGGALDLDDEQGALFALGEILESLGGRMSWIADASYDSIVRLTEIVLDKALPQTYEMTEHLSL